MEIITILTVLWMLVAGSHGSMVNLTHRWKPYFGWEANCSWNLYSDDALQSVRLYNKDKQFMVYRPERDGPSRSQNFQTVLWRVDCAESSARGVTGSCVLSAELYEPPADFTLTCEVSGERPMFRVDVSSINISPYVEPSAAAIVVSKTGGSERVTLNCSSSGLPAPTLLWYVGDQKVPPEFTGSWWNITSKLWVSWAAMSYSRVEAGLDASCVPEVTRAGHAARGPAARYSRGTHTSIQAATLLVPLALVLWR